MKKVINPAGIVLAAFGFSLLLISSSSGESDGGQWNLAGTWTYSITITNDPCGVGVNETASAQLTQSGNQVSLHTRTTVLSGECSASSVSVNQEREVEAGCMENVQGTLTIESEYRITGPGEFRYSGNCAGKEGCVVSFNIEFTR